MHSVDCIEGNSKSGVKFWGVIADSYNNTIGWDRAKTAVRKGKGKEDSSSQSRSSFAMAGIMSTLKKLGTLFTRAQIWKQYNKLRVVNTADMDAEELVTHREALRLIKKDLNFATQNATEVEDEDGE
jgi:hypothetical protein